MARFSGSDFRVVIEGSVGPAARRRRGVFITFEGVEGSGKTTQLSRVARLLRRHGHRVVTTREPGGTPVAERLRAVLLRAGREALLPECEALLVFAARCQHRAHVILPALERGAVVLCDRFFDSTLAYQGYARGLERAWLRRVNDVAAGGLSPDLTLLFDLPASQGLARRSREGTRQNRLDRERAGFHRLVRRGFLALARRDRGRIRVIDAAAGRDVVAARVNDVVLSFLGERRAVAAGGRSRR